jgi:hypothetical protein
MNRAFTLSALTAAPLALAALTGCSANQHVAQQGVTSQYSCCTQQASCEPLAVNLSLQPEMNFQPAPQRRISTHLGPNPFAGRLPSMHLALGAGDRTGTMVAFNTFALPVGGVGVATAPTEP